MPSRSFRCHNSQAALPHSYVSQRIQTRLNKKRFEKWFPFNQILYLIELRYDEKWCQWNFAGDKFKIPIIFFTNRYVSFLSHKQFCNKIIYIFIWNGYIFLFLIPNYLFQLPFWLFQCIRSDWSPPVKNHKSICFKNCSDLSLFA